MPGKTITGHQVHKYMQHRNKLTQVVAAARAGISERSPRRTSWSKATGPSGATGCWCAVRLPFAGGTVPCKRARANRQRHPRRGKKTSQLKALAAPAACDARLADPGALAGALLGALNSGHGINLYLRL